MHVELGRDLAVDLRQELLELDRAMAACRLEMTVPSVVLNAANRLVVPCRLLRRRRRNKRNNTQCLFAALKVHHGEVIGMASKTRNRWI